MSTEVAVRNSTALAITDEQQEFNQTQIAALSQLGIDSAGPGDLSIFFHQCKRTGLDPFAKQIYMIGRNSKNARTNQWETKYTIQTGIDGYRLIARRACDRSGDALGYEDTQWCDQNGRWHDVWIGPGNPVAAKVVVLRDGQRFPAIATWSEYVQTDRNGNPNSMWSRMGANQLAKCAEALALRKAFPQDLSGIYTTDEMDQADSAPVVAVNAVSRINAVASASPDEPVGGPTAADVDWAAEVELAGDDIDALRAIWKRAAALNADEWVRTMLTETFNQINQKHLDKTEAPETETEEATA